MTDLPWLFTPAQWGACGRSEPALRRAVVAGTVERVDRALYRLLPGPRPAPALVAAQGLRAVSSHQSAALLHGLPLVRPPDEVHVTVARSRSGLRRPGVVVHRSDLDPGEVDAGVTSPARTVMDCARSLPFAEALVVGDAALHLRLVTPDELALAARARPGARGTAAARRVVLAADGRAQSPLESLGRALLMEADLAPDTLQRPFPAGGTVIHVDAALTEARLALEFDGARWHDEQSGRWRHDLLRANAVALAGWRLLRLTWADVVHRPEQTVEMVRAAVQQNRAA